MDPNMGKIDRLREMFLTFPQCLADWLSALSSCSCPSITWIHPFLGSHPILTCCIPKWVPRWCYGTNELNRSKLHAIILSQVNLFWLCLYIHLSTLLSVHFDYKIWAAHSTRLWQINEVHGEQKSRGCTWIGLGLPTTESISGAGFYKEPITCVKKIRNAEKYRKQLSSLKSARSVGSAASTEM